MTNKKSLSEWDISTKSITPALEKPCVNIQTQVHKKVCLVELLGQQKLLYEELLKRDAILATMYLGAVTAFEAKAPDYLAMSAHGIRELIEKLPTNLGLVEPHKGPTLKERCMELSAKVNQAKQKSICYTGSKFEGEIDTELDRMLLGLIQFLERFEKDFPRRKAHMAQVVRGLDPLPVALPLVIEKTLVGQFFGYKNYFQSVAHHKTTDDDEFLGYLDRLERFLLDYLRPQTFADHDELDALIQEGENDA